jgi:adenylyl-sulfate kinase
MNQHSGDADLRNLTWHTLLPREKRWLALGQRPAIAWFTGLSGAGKSSIANAVDRALIQAGRHTMVLDGDNLRHGLSNDLGFSDADRIENIRRAAETARLMAEAGLVVIVSLISPFRQERAMARGILGDVPFLEIFIDTPLQVCEARDPKGLYHRARAGEISNFTGISASYEVPEAPDVVVQTEGCTIQKSATSLISKLMWLSSARGADVGDDGSRNIDLTGILDRARWEATAW